jgi:subtilase family serine protease
MKFARGFRKQVKRGPAPRVFACESLEERRMFAIDSGQPLMGDLAEPLAQPFAVLSTNDEATPLASMDPDPTAYTPTQIRHAYGYDQIFFKGSIAGDGTGQTIAIVNAYHTPTALADLNAFSTEFALPPPPSFTQVSQTGGDPSAIATNGNWALETALDIQWAHAFAPGANILLVEAATATFGDLTAAVSYARSVAGVSVVSMSWGAPEFSGELAYDTNFTTLSNHAGVVFAAAAGNAGSPGMYPGYSPNTLTVGGTTLAIDPNTNTISGEQAWSHGGGGISLYEPQPSFQNGFVTQSATQRTMPDVAFDADSFTGVPVYDSFNNGNVTPWVKVAGTSFATPSWGALVAIADQGRNLAEKPVLDNPTLMSMLYAMPASNFNDITIGSSTGATPQAATPGYDLVTGRGTPKAQLIVGDLVGVGAVSGTVFSDVNGNGLNDGDAGLSGWTVYSDLNNNSAFDPVAVNTFNSPNVPVSILNLATVTSTTTVPSLPGNIIDVNVTINITHNSDNNLKITLISPTGTRVVLANRVGGSGNNFTNTEFDDSAPILIDKGTAPFGATFHPDELLSAL